MSRDVTNWTRSTYSILDWLGDLGGLLDILLHIGSAIVTPVATFTLRQTLMSAFFRFKESSTVQEKSTNDSLHVTELIKKELVANTPIPSKGWYRVNFLCCNHAENRRYKGILKMSTTRI